MTLGRRVGTGRAGTPPRGRPADQLGLVQGTQRRQRDAEVGHQVIGDRTGGARQKIEQIPRRNVETCRARKDRIAHGRRQIGAVMIEHLAHEERIASRHPMQPCRVDVSAADEFGDRLHAQRRHDERLGVRGPRDVAEQSPQGASR